MLPLSNDKSSLCVTVYEIRHHTRVSYPYANEVEGVVDEKSKQYTIKKPFGYCELRAFVYGKNSIENSNAIHP